MRKFLGVMIRMWELVMENRLYVLAPILIVLALLSALVFYVGPNVVVMFIYAGV